jgi:[ribosomal protein S5]-alanine N-acetyltransferase
MIHSERFLIKELTVSDATNEYLNWLKYDPEILNHIKESSSQMTMNNLRNYIQEKNKIDNVRFFGIFLKDSEKHIGNIKFEPINIEESFAVMGTLIGDVDWRGKDVFSEIISVTGNWLVNKFGVKVIALVVDENNYSAIRAYEKSGFIFEDHKFFYENIEFNNPKFKSMILRLQ